jgi:hypothetical protein
LAAQTCPPGHAVPLVQLHIELTHDWPVWQLVTQLPQCSGSLAKLVQTPLQAV